ncbi:MAG: hypothetical protein ACRDTM_10375 [Micromonosporaceae bacterium]
MARKRSTVGGRLGLGAALLALAWLFHLGGRPSLSWFILLTLFVPYLVCVVPLPCRERTQQGGPCSFSRWGWLIGCGYHRWRRILRIFSAASAGRARPDVRPLGARSEPATSGSRHRNRVRAARAVEVVSLPPNGPGRRVYDAIILATAIVSAVAGVIQVL